MKKNNILDLTKLFSDASYSLQMGYAETTSAKSLVISPKTSEDCQEILKYCNQEEIKICCRGGGYSYGDMILNSEQVILDTSCMNQILDWNSETGLITVQPGVSFASIFKISLLHNWTLHSCPGGMDVTVGGAISNNVHGKDAWKSGNFGYQICSFKLLLASGEIIIVDKAKESLFKAVIGGMGLFGIITQATIQLKKIPSPFVTTRTDLAQNIEELIALLERRKKDSDFVVAWVDAFAKGSDLGRGYVSSASWVKDDLVTTPSDLNKSLTKPSLIFGFLPARPLWFVGRIFFKPFILNILNKIHYLLAKMKFSNKKNSSDPILFTDYNFMHNKIPDIREVYRPHGFIEFEPLLPKKNGAKIIRDLLILCQKFKSESLLCGVKSHKRDGFFVSFAGDGYSIGIDIQIAGRATKDIKNFTNAIIDFTNQYEGKIYLAKDEKLDKHSFQKMYPNYKTFLDLKNNFDPENRFSSDMFQRLME